MRTVILSIALAVSACAATTANRPVNVALVRHEIKDTITGQGSDRAITAMGKVTAASAVVFTTLPTGARQEETWSKVDGTWKLEGASQVSQN